MVEHMYFIKENIFTTLFIVSFNVLVAFTCVALVLGLISRLIILYFEKDFEEIQDRLGKKNIEKYSVTSDDDDFDEYE